MALPSSGPLSFSQIKAELHNTTSGSLRLMSDKAQKSTPDSVSEFYGLIATYLLAEVDSGTLGTEAYDGSSSGTMLAALTAQAGGYQQDSDDETFVAQSSQIAIDVNFSGYYNNAEAELYNENVYIWYDSDSSYYVNTTGQISNKSDGDINVYAFSTYGYY